MSSIDSQARATTGLPPEQALQLATQLHEYLFSGGTLSEMLDLSSEGMEALYAHGHQLYSQGRYFDALQAFSFLLMHNQYERRYYMGFAACLQMRQQPEDALKYYSMASLLDLSDPHPIFHSAQCMLTLARVAPARTALELVCKLCAGQPQHAALGQRAGAMCQLLAQANDSSDNKEQHHA
ncbi:MAG: SycD/LcrH family type III secretion system chaperone [Janthinobacterium lividum]